MVKRSIKGTKVPAKNLEYHCLKLFIRQPSKRFNAKQVIKKLQIKNTTASVQAVLSKLQAAGKIDLIKDEKYKLSKVFAPQSTTQAEVFDGHVDQIRSGAAYIVLGGERTDDIYVPAKKLSQALDGDKVRVKINKRYGKRIEGEIVKILERATDQFIGNLQQSKNYAFVVPDNGMVDFDIYVHPQDLGLAQDGDKVLVKVSDWPDRAGKNPIGKIVKVLDASDTHGVRPWCEY